MAVTNDNAPIAELRVSFFSLSVQSPRLPFTMKYTAGIATASQTTDNTIIDIVSIYYEFSVTLINQYVPSNVSIAWKYPALIVCEVA